MRNKLFVSHATGPDDQFTRWLCLKLVGMGYDVWCDLLTLKKGVDFWPSIEGAIRDHTTKFLVVLSQESNNKEGVLKEIAVANKVKKQIEDDAFIIPLHLDEQLAKEDINIEILRLNTVNFKTSWARGLQTLLEALQEAGVPKVPVDFARSETIYQQVFLHNKRPVKRPERYESNWFPISSIPPYLHFYRFGTLVPKDLDVRTLPFPAARHRDYIASFASVEEFIPLFPECAGYNRKKTTVVSTAKVLNISHQYKIIKNKTCRQLIIQLINIGFDQTMVQKGLTEYPMSNKKGYWFKKGLLPKDKHNRVQLVGKQLDKNWHFGLSAATKLYPFRVLMVSTHIYFTEDGDRLIESPAKQHAARRKQGRGWWNEEWRTKVMAFIHFLAGGRKYFIIRLGEHTYASISAKPLMFAGAMSYDSPDDLYMDEEIDILDATDMNDEQENQDQ